jgi:hypothetical protein
MSKTHDGEWPGKYFESRIQASDKLRGARLEAIDTRENVSYKNLGKH